jgi:hypothetical protein
VLGECNSGRESAEEREAAGQEERGLSAASHTPADPSVSPVFACLLALLVRIFKQVNPPSSLEEGVSSPPDLKGGCVQDCLRAELLRTPVRGTAVQCGSPARAVASSLAPAVPHAHSSSAQLAGRPTPRTRLTPFVHFRKLSSHAF